MFLVFLSLGRLPALCPLEELLNTDNKVISNGLNYKLHINSAFSGLKSDSKVIWIY